MRAVENIKLIIKMHGSDDPDGQLTSELVKDYLEALATIEDDSVHKGLLKELVEKYVKLEKRVDSLLKNTLPGKVADEIKFIGRFTPRPYACTILFTDFVGFTQLAENIPGEALIDTLDRIFKGFDDIVIHHRGTKVKTIGDAYMAVFGAPEEYDDHPVMAVKTARAFIDFLKDFNSERNQSFEMRVGIHTGTIMAGVVGKERMQFDVFGDNVNTASRFESSGLPGKINVSHATYLSTRHAFTFEERGEISLKHKADMKAYLVTGERKI